MAETSDRDDLAGAMLAAPIGATLLAGLIASVRGASLVFVDAGQPSPQPSEVTEAVARVGRMSFADLLKLALAAADLIGPWTSDATQLLSITQRWAIVLRPVADAIADRFGTNLDAPLDPALQQWWTDDCDAERQATLRFVDFDDVYGAGQFSWAGLWTISDPPESIGADLAHSWEMYGTPVTRWALPVRADARVFEIRRPADWARLVTGFPKHAEVDELVPDWAAVAARYDGIHLSWAGFITAEGYVNDRETSDDGANVVVLRHWSSERTHWLADVFGEPSPLDPDEPSGRRSRERAALAAGLGRSAP